MESDVSTWSRTSAACGASSWLGNFSSQVSNYTKELEEMKHVTKQEFIASLRRYYTWPFRFCLFTCWYLIAVELSGGSLLEWIFLQEKQWVLEGASIYRGVTRFGKLSWYSLEFFYYFTLGQSFFFFLCLLLKSARSHFSSRYRHHQQGRWQARIGRVAGNKDLYLGTFGEYAIYVLSTISIVRIVLPGGTPAWTT